MKKTLISVFTAGAISGALGAASAQQIYLDFGSNPGYGPPPPGYGYGPPPPAYGYPPPPGYGPGYGPPSGYGPPGPYYRSYEGVDEGTTDRPIPNLERMPARLDCTGRPMQALSWLLAGQWPIEQGHPSVTPPTLKMVLPLPVDLELAENSRQAATRASAC